MNARCITTKAGVRIGIAYIAPPQRVQGDAVKVQEALLERRTLLPQTTLQRIWGYVWGKLL